MEALLQFTTARAVPLTARLVFDGDTTRHDGQPHDGAPVVEFYDRRHADHAAPLGLYMGFFGAASLAHRARPFHVGLTPGAWTLDVQAMAVLSCWLRHHLRPTAARA